MFCCLFNFPRVFDIPDSSSTHFHLGNRLVVFFFVFKRLIFCATSHQSVFSSDVIVLALAFKFSFTLSHRSFLSLTFHTFLFLSVFGSIFEAATSAAFTEHQRNDDDNKPSNHTHTDDHCFKVQPAYTPSCCTETAYTGWWQDVFVRVILACFVGITP